MPALKHNPIIVALDVESAAEARALVARLGPAIDFYKVGMELYAATGIDFVRELIAEGKQVFLDLKFHDIGETVRRAVAQVARTGVRFLTIHGLSQVMRAAVQGRADSKLQLLAVTVLTSLDQSDLEADGYSLDVSALVELRARQAIAIGVDGLVASPLEAARLRAMAGAGTLLVVPGVRSAGISAGDQKRVATPAQAILDGADYVVIGRQITRAADPAAESIRIMDEIALSPIS